MNDMPDPNMLIEATRLTRAGRLNEATALIRPMLRGGAAPAMTAGTAADTAPHDRKPLTIDMDAGTNGKTARPLLEAETSAQPHATHPLRALLDRVTRRSGRGKPTLRQPVPRPTPEIVPEGGKFIEATYSNPAGRRAYKLYIPRRYRGQPLPLVVMLHGCSQSPDDFAAGTRMNVIAEEQACLVAYPEQPSD